MGVYGLNAVTSIVAESPHKIFSIYPLPVDLIVAQIQAVASAFPIHAIKIGMLYSGEIAENVAKTLARLDPLPQHIVVDPVLASSTGDDLAKATIIDSYKKTIFPLATVITPNIPEAEFILNRKLKSPSDYIEAVIELSKTYHTACLLKGGHGCDDLNSIDYLYANETLSEFSLPRVNIPMSHGTGCCLSSAITAKLAKGHALITAIRQAKDWLHQAIMTSNHWKKQNLETLALNIE
jgi:hydroxymethylpyrimidine/phosphomethylpyrimidine kinase